MRGLFIACSLVLALATPVAANPVVESVPFVRGLFPVAFMEGDWRADGGGAGPGAGGDSSIHFDLGGYILIRRDHVVVKTGGAFDIYMMIYPDDSETRAEYIDTEGHVIHYRLSGSGRATNGDPWATFEARSQKPFPSYRLTYAAVGDDRLHIRFEIAPPGGDYKSYSEGDVVRQKPAG